MIRQYLFSIRRHQLRTGWHTAREYELWKERKRHRAIARTLSKREHPRLFWCSLQARKLIAKMAPLGKAINWLVVRLAG